MEIMTTKQASKLWGVTSRRVSEMCRDGRIEGAYKIGTAWVMPADTMKPKDERVTTGKWVGYKRRDKEGQQ
ncbi:MAG: helix-turn-helix domain-containing protein [Oscillospiraceae bacterium]|nr:helix-turn-helix domain-containing protein [Oscillospiraceae bacterium]